MKLTKREFNRVIKEEIENMLNELEDSEEGSRLYQRVKGKEAELKAAIKDGKRFSWVVDNMSGFHDLDKEYYDDLKKELKDELKEGEWKDSSTMRHKFKFGDRSKKPSGQGYPPHKFKFGDPSARTEAPPSPRPQGHEDLENIMMSIKDAYGAQSSDEEKEQFETFLLKNVMQYMEAWREERAQKNLGDLK